MINYMFIHPQRLHISDKRQRCVYTQWRCCHDGPCYLEFDDSLGSTIVAPEEIMRLHPFVVWRTALQQRRRVEYGAKGW